MTYEYLKEHFRYHRSGYLIRIKFGSGPRHVIVKGTPNSTGYRTINVRGKSALIHRAIFLLVKGWLPKALDHKDRDKSNNRIGNLRPASQEINCHNRSVSKNTVSGVRGVTFKKDKKLWRGRLTVSGRSIHICSSKNKTKVIRRVRAAQRAVLETLLSKQKTIAHI